MVEQRVKFTVEDYELFPEDGRRHEIVDGEHYVTAAPSTWHQRVLVRLLYALETYARQTGEGLLLPAPTDVVLSNTDVVQPDLLFVRPGRKEIVGRRVEGAPDIAVEILSPSSRRLDEVLKRRAYEHFGVLELWVVDPETEVVRAYRRQAEGPFGRPDQLSAEHGDTLDTPLLPGFAVPVAELFAG
jgi:Uma2 family endonuclease